MEQDIGFLLVQFILGILDMIGTLIMTDGSAMDLQHVMTYGLLALWGVLFPPTVVVAGPILISKVFGDGSVEINKG
jgi:hypothetical protein